MVGKTAKAGKPGVKAKASGKLWGYIEGYYGRLFGWEERASLLAHIAGLGGGAYLYAPKEDSLHRRDWRIPYPKPWRAQFAKLAAAGRRRGVDLVPGMAPGLSFDYLKAADYRLLLAKLRAFQDMGCRTLALLMDDISPELPRNCREAFSTLGEAHGLLLHRLLDDLGRDGREIKLWFCPTVYTDQFATGPVEKDAYLLDLAATMPRQVTLMWTGPRIISQTLGRRELAPLSRLFRGDILIWDNLYANDYCPGKLFAGPYRGRPRDLWKLTRGVMLNPTGLPVTDRLLLGLLAASRRGEDAGKAWRKALAEYAVPEAFFKAAPFLDSPFFQVKAADLSPRRVEALRKALKALIWDWKGSLHQEWYPYLFMLDADLKASARGKDKPDEAWVRKRYPPLIARLLLDR